LKEDGVLASFSPSGISQMPNIGDNRYIIAVQRGHIKQAKEIIEEARRDNVISTKGIFL
jgi:hypothetical protein